jgi:pimeloyl-ACP methyl ester carboxylesterase
VLFVHGMHAGSWYLRPWLYAAAQSGWDAWALNLRGHHGSRPVRDVGRISVLDYVEDVHDCLRTLREVVLVGHSMGGLIAQKVAEDSRVRAAAFVTSAAPRGIRVVTWPVLWRMPSYLGAILGNRAFSISPGDAAALLGNRVTPELADWAYPQLVPESGRAAREMALGSITVDQGRVRCPTLVVGAEHDRITPVRVQQKIAARYGSEYLQAAGHAHLPMLEPGGERLFAEVLGWLARVA